MKGEMMQEDIINWRDDAEGSHDAEREHYNEGRDDAGGGNYIKGGIMQDIIDGRDDAQWRTL